MLAFSVRTGGGLLAALVIVIATCAPAQVTPRLSEVRNWAFQLQNVDPWEIKESPYDAVVIDYGIDHGGTAFPREVVDHMRTKPDGRKRLILAYLSIGEAESYRYYWQDSWSKVRPEWLEPENPDWPGILAAGFDGVYLDGVDKFEQWKRRRPTAVADMVDLVVAIAAYGRASRKDFLIVPQNGDGLLGQPRFLRTIDGFAREDLLYGEKHPEARNSQRSIADSVGRLRRLVAAGVPVFIVEYATSPDLAASMLREIKEFGYIGYVARRDLKSLSPPAFGCGQPDCSR